MTFEKELGTMLGAETPNIVAIAKAILDRASTEGSIKGSVVGSAIEFASLNESCLIPSLRATAYFRMILARLGVQAQELTGQELNLYENESRFEWNGSTIHQLVNNQNGSLEFSITTLPSPERGA